VQVRRPLVQDRKIHALDGAEIGEYLFQMLLGDVAGELLEVDLCGARGGGALLAAGRGAPCLQRLCCSLGSFGLLRSL